MHGVHVHVQCMCQLTHWSKHPHPEVSSQQPVEDEHKRWTEEHGVVKIRPEQELSRPGTVCPYDWGQPKQSTCIQRE